jgi:hypothetical protein
MSYTMKNCKVEFSAGGTTWTDVTSDSNSVTMSGFELQTASNSVFGQAKVDQTVGGYAIGTITIRAVYTETTTSAWGLAHTAWVNRTNLYVRWSPRGGTTGQYSYTSDAGYVKNPVWPVGEDGPSMIMSEIVIETPFVTQAAVA